MTDGSKMWLNTIDYTPFQLALFGLGCLAWAIAYGRVIWGIRKNKFCEIPAAAVTANIAWEIVWGFCFEINLGLLFVWGYRLWFLLDVYINYGLFKYGHEQIVNPFLKRYFKPLYFFSVISWTVGLYYMYVQGYDTPVGTISAFVLTVIMSFMYIALFTSQSDIGRFSWVVAWSKGIGNALFAVWAILVYPTNYFLFALIFVTLFFDAMYLVLFHHRRAG